MISVLLTVKALFTGTEFDLFVNESSNKVWIEGFCFIENYWDLHICDLQFWLFPVHHSFHLCVYLCMDECALLLSFPIPFSIVFLIALFTSYFILRMNAH